MANKALLFWCAGSALVCGSAALATSALWRIPASQSGLPAPTESKPADVQVLLVHAPIAENETPAPMDSYVPLASVSFFEPPLVIGPSLFRGTMEAAPSPMEAAALEFPPPAEAADFVEVKPDPEPSPLVTVLPPPRPRFGLARLDNKASIGELPGQPAPGFEIPAPVPQAAPGWNWSEVFRAPAPSGNERLINAGMASWYGPGFHGRKTASGERFDQNDMTAAHRTLPFGTRVKVVDEKSGRSIVVRINDRGPFSHGRVIDLSKQAAQSLGMGGLARVTVVSAN